MKRDFESIVREVLPVLIVAWLAFCAGGLFAPHRGVFRSPPVEPTIEAVNKQESRDLSDLIQALERIEYLESTTVSFAGQQFTRTINDQLTNTNPNQFLSICDVGLWKLIIRLGLQDRVSKEFNVVPNPQIVLPDR